MKRFAAIWFSLLYLTFTVTAANALSAQEFACEFHDTNGAKTNPLEADLSGTPCSDETHSTSLLLHKELKHNLSVGKIKVPRLNSSNQILRNYEALVTATRYSTLGNCKISYLHPTPIFLRYRVLRI